MYFEFSSKIIQNEKLKKYWRSTLKVSHCKVHHLMNGLERNVFVVCKKLKSSLSIITLIFKNEM